MKICNKLFFLILSILFVSSFGLITINAETSEQPGIYSSQKDAAGAIKTAVEQMNEDCKRIILIFGADWCPWCNRMARFFKENEKVATLLSNYYVEIKVDLGKWDKNLDLVEKYSMDRKAGIPSIVILDSNGNRLLFQETGSLEEGKGYSEEKIMKFLLGNIYSVDRPCVH